MFHSVQLGPEGEFDPLLGASFDYNACTDTDLVLSALKFSLGGLVFQRTALGSYLHFRQQLMPHDVSCQQ